MSKTAAVVCEGPTDFPILEAIVMELWPEVEQVLPLQPPLDELGKPTTQVRGWSAVKKWCEDNAENLHQLLSDDFGSPIDLLVVALDVDIAILAGILDPPRQELTPYAATRLCNTVKSWLRSGSRRLPTQLVIALPAMAIEAWVIPATVQGSNCPSKPERLANPAMYLVEQGKLELVTKQPRSSDHGKTMKLRPHKEITRYNRFAKEMINSLDKVRKACREAERFCNKIEQRRDA